MLFRSDIVDYVTERQKLSHSSRRQIIAIVKSFFKWYSRYKIDIGITPDEIRKNLVEKQRVEKIIFMGIPNILKGGKLQIRKDLTIEEINNLLGEAKTYPGEYKIIFLMLYFGCRKSELFAIKAENVDFKHSKLILQTGKTGNERILFYEGRVRLLLEWWIEHRSEFESYDINNLLKKYEYMLKIKLYPHRFRHSFNTHMREVIRKLYGTDDILLKKIMGHTTAADMTAVYGGITEFEKKVKEVFSHHYLAAKWR